jgi:hypothetical protein
MYDVIHAWTKAHELPNITLIYYISTSSFLERKQYFYSAYLRNESNHWAAKEQGPLNSDQNSLKSIPQKQMEMLHSYL